MCLKLAVIILEHKRTIRGKFKNILGANMTSFMFLGGRRLLIVKIRMMKRLKMIVRAIL